MLDTTLTSIDTTAQPETAPMQPVLTFETILDNLDQFRSRPAKGFEVLRDYTDYCVEPRIAAVFVECSLAVNRLDLVEMVLPMTQDTSGILSAMYHMAKNAPQQALDALIETPEDLRHQTIAFGIRIRANILTGEYDGASKAVYDWSLKVPHSPMPYRAMGTALDEKGDKRAERWLQRAVNVSGQGGVQVLDMASFLIKQGRKNDARAQLETLKYATGRTKRRKQRLLKKLG